ncbi:YceI family protein [Dyella japonica]|uniref:Polyisoprenoid-binding protein n=1 Tax=Dyella japonica A8 TaxID=1217721 RepID=A0A075K0X5_9GAMM|nr:YceI family protein [Dyella japonica]AIF45908.1 polyisoprenoid-binding protein [Dyella japonica A8]
MFLSSRMTRTLASALLFPLAAATAQAGAATYVVDPAHTYPSFEADHFGGLSTWRGKFDRTSGKVTLDKTAGTGSVDITVDATSVDFGLDAMNEKARSNELFDAAKYPTATYRGTLAGFVNGAPTKVDGSLTLHGVTRPLELAIKSFKCVPHPLYKRELCGADAYASFKRDEFGITAGKDYGFNMDVVLRIQVEALVDDGSAGKTALATPAH